MNFLSQIYQKLFSLDQSSMTLSRTLSSPSPVMNWKEAVKEMDDLDIFIFQGKGYWFSYLVEYATWSDFSHIGLLLKGATGIKPDLTEDLMLESGSGISPDPVDHQIKFGVQVSRVSNFEEYDGEIYCRKLIIDKEKREQLKSKIAQIYQKIKDAPYDYYPQDLIRVECGLDVGDCQRTDDFFCSALTSFVYVQLGLLPKEIMWDLVKPKDFSTEFINDKLIGAKFGPLTRIK